MVFCKHILATLLVLHNTANDSKNQKQPPEVFLGKGTLKICSKLTEEQPC